MVSLPSRESTVWSDTGIAYSSGEEIYVAGEQPIAGIDNRAMYNVTTDIKTLFEGVNGHTHDDRYYTESEADSRFASGTHDHDGAYVNVTGDTMSGNLDLDGNRLTSVSRIHNTGAAIHTNTNWQFEGNNISEVYDLTVTNNNNVGGDVISQGRTFAGGLTGVTQSDDQAASSKAGAGYTATPWVYTTAIEADKEGGALSTSIHLGADSGRSSADQVMVVTNGNDNFSVDPDNNTNFHSNEAKNFRLENRTSDPSNPQPGQMWIRTDL